MKAVLSKKAAVADIDDVEARIAVEGYDAGADLAAEAEILAKGETSFRTWWENAGLVSELQTCDDAALEAYLAGYLSMALHLGHLPEGGAV